MNQPDFVPIYARIERHLREEIASGRLHDGDRTPSEPELARAFNTTRATVARALQQLVFEGIIVRRSGSGTFVSRPLSAPIDLTRVRSFEEQLAATGAEIGYEILDFSRRAAGDGERGSLHLDPGSDVYTLARVRIVNGKKVSVEHRVVPSELGGRMTREMLQTRSIHGILDEHFSLKVHRVEGRIRAGLANPKIARQLDIKQGSPLLIRDYVLFSVDRRPLVCGESFYCEDFRIDYVVQQSPDD